MNHILAEKKLFDEQKNHLNRFMRVIGGTQDAKIELNGKKYLNFCSNNYLGLANDQRLIQAAVQGMNQYGFGSGASRLVCGNMKPHLQLEEKIASFKGAERCLLFSSGYMANIGILSSLFGKNDLIFSDRLNHASIIDGVKLSGATLIRYRHCDMDHLEYLLKRENINQRKCIVTDSVFSMDGDIAPLDHVVRLAKDYQCFTMIDEAHALGVMGRNGKGLAEHFQLESDIDIQMGTLSKAVGTFGAYCCGSKELIEFLINKARSFIYTTGMPPSTASASIKAIEIIRGESHLRENLWKNTQMLKIGLKAAGFNTLNSVTPIIPVLIGDSQKAVTFSECLMTEGIYISAIRPPTVPENTARLRITVTAKHDQNDINELLIKINKIGKELGVI